MEHTTEGTKTALKTQDLDMNLAVGAVDWVLVELDGAETWFLGETKDVEAQSQFRALMAEAKKLSLNALYHKAYRKGYEDSAREGRHDDF